MSEDENPRRANVRPLADLSPVLGVTPAAVYMAFHKGHIGGVIRVGTLLKIIPAAYAYHSCNGYGTRVRPFGAAETEAGDAAVSAS